MKKISLKVNIFVSAALILFVGLSACRQPTKSDGSSDAGPAGEIPVAYVDMDTLMFYYNLADDLKEQLAAKQQKAEKNLMANKQQLQEEIMNFNRRRQAGLLSANEVRAQTEVFQSKEQEYIQRGQAVQTGLMQASNDANNEIYENIVSHLEEFNKNGRYKFILNYSKNGGGVLLADKGMDITQEVLKGLNKQYKAKKESDEAGEGTDKK